MVGLLKMRGSVMAPRCAVARLKIAELQRGFIVLGMRRFGFVLVAVAVFCCFGFAQKPAATGAVIGHVICADTNTPARLAVVVLRPVPEAKAVDSPEAAKKDPSAAMRAVEARRVQTMLDGSFSIPNVAPGTYLVLASMPGYISPLASLSVGNDDLLEPTTELRKRLLENVPTVTVDGAGAASINISLERAAAVSGTIVYDDGSPAPGVEVKLRERKNGKWEPVQNVVGDGMGSGNAVTDDRGNFRIIGLPAMKEAIVEADLSVQTSILSFRKNGFGSSGGPSFTFSFFSGDAVRANEAKPFSVTAGEDRAGEDISLPLSKLHKLRGVLVSKVDGHTLNQGSVSLMFADDHTLLGSAQVDRGDESFDFPFVPNGDYILRVDFAADARYEDRPNPPGSVPPYSTESTVIHAYTPIEVPLHVDSDRTELTVDVPDGNPARRNIGQR